MYASIDATFQDVGMHTIARPGRRTTTRVLQPPESARPELCIVSIVPFGFKRTERAVWAQLCRDQTNRVRLIGIRKVLPYYTKANVLFNIRAASQHEASRSRTRFRLGLLT